MPDEIGYWKRQALTAESENRFLLQEVNREKRITLAYGLGLLISWSLLVSVCAGWV